MTPDELAKKCAEAQWQQDPASRALNMKIEEIRAGFAVFSMTITDKMVNGHGICHGGYIFTLADSTFAFACNSHNQRMVAAQCEISYLAPASLGDELVATAKERVRQERSSITDVTVKKRDGTLIAEFRGHGRTVKGVLLPEHAA
ncbi:MAG: hydroxyphenylacetyl-CoA thioesterase PaaI [Pseudomonadota bacterium]